MANQYEAARDIYAAWGVDTEEALRKMDTIPVSINCWQLDDLTGFEDFDAALTRRHRRHGQRPRQAEKRGGILRLSRQNALARPGCEASGAARRCIRSQTA